VRASIWSQRQGVYGLGLGAAANGQIRMAHELCAGLPAGAPKGGVVDGDREGGRRGATKRLGCSPLVLRASLAALRIALFDSEQRRQIAVARWPTLRQMTLRSR